MLQIMIVYHLSNGYVVQYGNTRYILNDWDITFIDGQAYTYPDKLIQVYHESRQSNTIQ